MRYLANLRAVPGAIITRLEWAGAVQHLVWSEIMPANSPFASAFAAQIK